MNKYHEITPTNTEMKLSNDVKKLHAENIQLNDIIRNINLQLEDTGDMANRTPEQLLSKLGRINRIINCHKVEKR